MGGISAQFFTPLASLSSSTHGSVPTAARAPSASAKKKNRKTAPKDQADVMSLEDLALGLVSLPASVDPFADLNMEQPLGSAGTALAVVSLKYSPTKEVPRLKTPKSTASSARCR